MTSVASMIRDAEWLAHRYDTDRDAVHFRHVPRAVHRSATFLIDADLPPGPPPTIVARDAAIAAMPARAPLHFIFHSAFCCSTLVARALDLPGTAMGLKEPPILNDIVGWRHRGSSARPAEVARALDHSLALLSRPFAPGEAVIVKPSNVVNGLIVAMLTMRPDAHALLMYAPLETYLKSIAKKGIDGRLWVRDLLDKLLQEGLVDLGFELRDYLRLTDLQVAAVGWLAQHALFARVTTQFGARVRTLDSERLLATPETAMAAIARHFALPLSAGSLEEMTGGPAFTKHSKSGATFGTQARAAEYAAAAAAHGDEIEKVAAWARAVAENAGVSMDLSATAVAQRVNFRPKVGPTQAVPRQA